MSNHVADRGPLSVGQIRHVADTRKLVLVEVSNRLQRLIALMPTEGLSRLRVLGGDCCELLWFQQVWRASQGVDLIGDDPEQPFGVDCWFRWYSAP